MIERAPRLIVLAAAAAVMPQASQRANVPAQAVVDAASSYVQAYEQQLTSVLADETYEQRILAQTPLDRSMPRTRTTRSEMFFMTSPGGHDWMAIRDIIAVDGQPIPDRLDVRDALRTLPAAEVARTFKTRNSRLNLGRIVRNFNEPTLSLLVLDSRHRPRFTFERLRTERTDGIDLVTFGFTEREGPTLIAGLDGRAAFSKGQVTVEEATGVVRKVILTVTIDGVRMELSTVYGRDAKLGIWVPVVFQERYNEGVEPAPRVPGSPRFESIACQAHYKNFRRFETTIRIR